MIKKLLSKADEDAPPLEFSTYSAKHFMKYLLSLQTDEGTRLSISSYSTKHSALYHLFHMYNKNMTTEFAKELTTLFKGLKRQVAQERQSGEGKITTGKIPITFPLYRRLNKYMLKETTLESVWARCFLTTTWNLCC